MELENIMEDYKKMSRCVFQVFAAALEENMKMSIDITGIDSCMDDIEGSSQVQTGEDEDIRKRMLSME